MQQAKLNMFQVPDTARRVDSACYVGMAINPVEFSQQLSRFQLSLQSETSAVVTQAGKKKRGIGYSEEAR